jgi:hypothetical protein
LGESISEPANRNRATAEPSVATFWFDVAANSNIGIANGDAILTHAQAAATRAIRNFRGEVLEWPNRAAC